MHRTIFTTPVVNTALRGLSLAFLRVKGWTVEGGLPAHAEKCVLIAAHTSNWDLPYTLMVAFVLRLNVYWVGKAKPLQMALRPGHALAGRHCRQPRTIDQTWSPPMPWPCKPPTGRCNWWSPLKAHAANPAKRQGGKPTFITSPKAQACLS